MFTSMYNMLISAPLKKLYYYGPSIGGVGFWGGKEFSEICHLLTSMESAFWMENSEKCESLINTRFGAFQISLEVILYFVILFQMIHLLPSVCFVLWGKIWRERPKKRKGQRKVILYS